MSNDLVRDFNVHKILNYMKDILEVKITNA